MHILIGGGSGFVGSALTAHFRARGDTVTWVSRTPGTDRITWDDVAAGRVPRCDVVINLAGEHILNLRRRWNDEYRRDLVRSRVGTTTALVNTLNVMPKPPAVFISTAGKCFYGSAEAPPGDRYPELDEYSSPMEMDFPASMVALWENAADAIDRTRIRHIHVRLGVILGAVERVSLLGKLWRVGRGRGILPLMRLPFCLGVGAVMGHGRQPMPWIHIDDVVGLFVHLVDAQTSQGRYNAVAPGIVSNRKFTELLARRLHRPIAWAVPAWLVRRIVGEDRASILLAGQNVRPKRTLESGYRFRFPDLPGALRDLVHITV
jgi:uncharacterized protein (TIGR01777 family)